MAVCQAMIKKGRICTKQYLVDPAHIIPNLIPRPLPRFSLTAMENSLHGCEVLSGWRSGKKGTSFPRMLLLAYICINAEAPQPPGKDMTTSRQSAFMLSYVILPIGNAISVGNWRQEKTGHLIHLPLLKQQSHWEYRCS